MTLLTISVMVSPLLEENPFRGPVFPIGLVAVTNMPKDVQIYFHTLRRKSNPRCDVPPKY
jgi:hypothetical protein